MSLKEKIVIISINIFIVIIISFFSVYYIGDPFNGIRYSKLDQIKNTNIIKGKKDNLADSAITYEDIKEMIYPVGSIYMSITDNTVAKVQERFGGTWQAFGVGQTLMGVNTSDTDFNTVLKTGGSKSQSYTPAGTNTGTSITVAQLPAHSHTFTGTAVNTGSNGSHGHTYSFKISSTEAKGYGLDLTQAFTDRIAVTGSGSTTNKGAHTHSVTAKGTISNTGSGQAHTHTFKGTAATISHMQPYVTVYMYKRVS